MQQPEPTSPTSPGGSEYGEPGEQRRREKAILQQLNQRLETVLGNIRRDNITKARQIRDLEERVQMANDVGAVLGEDQASLDKTSQDVKREKFSQMSRVTKLVGIKQGISYVPLRIFMLLQLSYLHL